MAGSGLTLAAPDIRPTFPQDYRDPFTALREFTLNGTDHATHREQGSMIRRYVAWRNRNTGNPRLRRIVDRANVA